KGVVAVARLGDVHRGVAAAAALFHHRLVVVAVDDLHRGADRAIVLLVDVVVVAVSFYVYGGAGAGVAVLQDHALVVAAGLGHRGVVGQGHGGQGQGRAQSDRQCGQFAVHVLLLVTRRRPSGGRERRPVFA